MAHLVDALAIRADTAMKRSGFIKPKMWGQMCDAKGVSP